MKEKVTGNCAICGERKILTYEHVPPKAARNSTPKRVKGFEELFDPKSFTYGKDRRLHRGLGGYFLCQPCNNFTGGAYGQDYADFAAQCIDHFVDRETMFRINEFKFNIKPLNVFKQIISIFMSVNQNILNTHLDKDLREFVLEKSSNEFPDRYRVFMYSTIDRTCRFNGLSAMPTDKGLINVSEFVHFPFGFQLGLNCESTEKMLEITDFAKMKYDDILPLSMTMPMLDVKGPLIGNIMPIDIDFKTKAKG